MSPRGQKWKIGQVADRTGLSKELIHHYLRQGLLPRSSSRARYDERQLRLLLLIKKLRDDHNLPLEAIRGLFEVYDFDPARLELLVLAESLGARLSRLADDRSLGLGRTFTADELAAAAGVTTERLETYLERRVITALDEADPPRFTPYDANLIALCERGVALGIPFEAFRTVASHARVAFELEHREFFDLGEIDDGGDQRLSELFLRRELVAGFVQNVYQAQVQGFLTRSLDRPAAARTSLDAVVYRPSDAFIVRHGLEGRVARLGELVSAAPERPEAWLEAAGLLLHAGRYREAAFILEQGLERAPEDRALQAHYGVALLLEGESERGRARLTPLADAGGDEAPLCRVYLALSAFTALSAPGRRRQATDWERVRALVDAALERPGAPGPLSHQVPLLAAWLLTALPQTFRALDRGRALLAGAFAAQARPSPGAPPLPGLEQRARINAAFMLHDCLVRAPADGMPPLEALRTEICRLDPASAFAREVFLAAADRSPTPEEEEKTQ